MVKKLKLIVIVVVIVSFIGLFFVPTDSILSEPVGYDKNNTITLEEISLVKTLPQQDGYIYLTASFATYNDTEEEFFLKDLDVVLKDLQNNFVAHASKGSYKINEYFLAESDIFGSWNEFIYTLSPKGKFYFDFSKREGTLGDDVVLSKQSLLIKSKKLHYFLDKKELLFSKDVEVSFFGGK